MDYSYAKHIKSESPYHPVMMSEAPVRAHVKLTTAPHDSTTVHEPYDTTELVFYANRCINNYFAFSSGIQRTDERS